MDDPLPAPRSNALLVVVSSEDDSGEAVQAAFEMTVGKAKLAEILQAFPADSSHWNEAQNRFQFIDRLLIECLGWNQPLMAVEVTDESGGRADYLLGKPVRAALEAKREATRFDLLPVAKKGKVRSLRPLIDGCKVLAAVVQRAGSGNLHSGDKWNFCLTSA